MFDCGKTVSVFPYNIYSANTVMPRPYFRYEPKGPGTFLAESNADVNPWGPPSSYARMYESNGYGQGNLQGKTCKCYCPNTPSNTNESQLYSTPLYPEAKVQGRFIQP